MRYMTPMAGALPALVLTASFAGELHLVPELHLDPPPVLVVETHFEPPQAAVSGVLPIDWMDRGGGTLPSGLPSRDAYADDGTIRVMLF